MLHVLARLSYSKPSASGLYICHCHAITEGLMALLLGRGGLQLRLLVHMNECDLCSDYVSKIFPRFSFMEISMLFRESDVRMVCKHIIFRIGWSTSVSLSSCNLHPFPCV